MDAGKVGPLFGLPLRKLRLIRNLGAGRIAAPEKEGGRQRANGRLPACTPMSSAPNTPLGEDWADAPMEDSSRRCSRHVSSVFGRCSPGGKKLADTIGLRKKEVVGVIAVFATVLLFALLLVSGHHRTLLGEPWADGSEQNLSPCYSHCGSLSETFCTLPAGAIKSKPEVFTKKVDLQSLQAMAQEKALGALEKRREWESEDFEDDGEGVVFCREWCLVGCGDSVGGSDYCTNEAAEQCPEVNSGIGARGVDSGPGRRARALAHPSPRRPQPVHSGACSGG